MGFPGLRKPGFARGTHVEKEDVGPPVERPPVCFLGWRFVCKHAPGVSMWGQWCRMWDGQTEGWAEMREPWAWGGPAELPSSSEAGARVKDCPGPHLSLGATTCAMLAGKLHGCSLWNQAASRGQMQQSLRGRP